MSGASASRPPRALLIGTTAGPTVKGFWNGVTHCTRPQPESLEPGSKWPSPGPEIRAWSRLSVRRGKKRVRPSNRSLKDSGAPLCGRNPDGLKVRRLTCASHRTGWPYTSASLQARRARWAERRASCQNQSTVANRTKLCNTHGLRDGQQCRKCQRERRATVDPPFAKNRPNYLTTLRKTHKSVRYLLGWSIRVRSHSNRQQPLS